VAVLGLRIHPSAVTFGLEGKAWKSELGCDTESLGEDNDDIFIYVYGPYRPVGKSPDGDIGSSWNGRTNLFQLVQRSFVVGKLTSTETNRDVWVRHRDILCIFVQWKLDRERWHCLLNGISITAGVSGFNTNPI
jgi:hypothetical protein